MLRLSYFAVAMIRYYWGRFWPFLLFAFGIEAVENLFTVFFEYRNMDFGLLPLLKTAYVFVTEFAVTMWLLAYSLCRLFVDSAARESRREGGQVAHLRMVFPVCARQSV